MCLGTETGDMVVGAACGRAAPGGTVAKDPAEEVADASVGARIAEGCMVVSAFVAVIGFAVLPVPEFWLACTPCCSSSLICVTWLSSLNCANWPTNCVGSIGEVGS